MVRGATTAFGDACIERGRSARDYLHSDQLAQQTGGGVVKITVKAGKRNDDSGPRLLSPRQGSRSTEQDTHRAIARGRDTNRNHEYGPAPGRFTHQVEDRIWVDSTRDRQLPVRIYAPSLDAGRGPFATVVFSHGFGDPRVELPPSAAAHAASSAKQ